MLKQLMFLEIGGDVGGEEPRGSVNLCLTESFLFCVLTVTSFSAK